MVDSIKNPSFFTKISYAHGPLTPKQKFTKTCEWYWSSGNRKAKILHQLKDKHLFVLELETKHQSKKRIFRAILIRIGLGMTCIFPIITLIGKLYFRNKNGFTSENLPRNICKTPDFEKTNSTDSILVVPDPRPDPIKKTSKEIVNDLFAYAERLPSYKHSFSDEEVRSLEKGSYILHDAKRSPIPTPWPMIYVSLVRSVDGDINSDQFILMENKELQHCKTHQYFSSFDHFMSSIN